MTPAHVLERPPDLLRVSDLTREQLVALLDLSAGIKSEPRRFLDALHGETLALIFEKPSTRTRVSMSAAAARLGMLPLSLRPDELQLGRGEPIADTARVLSGYCAAIAIRTFAHELVEELAEAATVPVINALTDEHHPCQALGDMLTLRERLGRLDGIALAYVGDGNNVCNSLVEAGNLLGLDVRVACPAGYEPKVAGATVTADPLEAVRGADAVYTDVWVSMGDEETADERRRALAPYRIDDALLDRAAPGDIALHCLPAHPGEEITAEVLYGSRQRIWDQAENRRHAQKALLELLVSGR